MGNKHSCCVYASPQVTRKEGAAAAGQAGGRRGFDELAPNREESVGNLQHISEREPEDWDTDPSSHPRAGTIFMERSKASIQSKSHKSPSVTFKYLSTLSLSLQTD